LHYGDRFPVAKWLAGDGRKRVVRRLQAAALDLYEEPRANYWTDLAAWISIGYDVTISGKP
jgi:hypothetical protein